MGGKNEEQNGRELISEQGGMSSMGGEMICDPQSIFVCQLQQMIRMPLPKGELS